MTNAEAIEILKSRRMCATYVDSEYVDSVDIEAVDMAISALEKQEGKKPIEVYPNGKPGVGHFCCPNCNRGLLRRNECVYCGQRIDWGDEHGAD